MNPKLLAKALRDIGHKNVPEDTRLVYVNEPEYAMLQHVSGRGEPDKTTGIEHFDGGDGDGESGDGGWSGTSDGEGGFSGGNDMANAASVESSIAENAATYGLGGPDQSQAINDAFNEAFGTNVGNGSWNMGQAGRDEEVSAGLNPGPGENDRASNMGRAGGYYGSYEEGNITADPSFGQYAQAWMANHPSVVSAVNGLVGLANPAIGAGLNLASSFITGNEGRGVGQVAGGLLGGPIGSQVGGALGGYVDSGRAGSAFDSLANNGSSTIGADGGNGSDSAIDSGSGASSVPLAPTRRGGSGGSGPGRPQGGFTRAAYKASAPLVAALRAGPNGVMTDLDTTPLQGIRRRYYGE